MLSKLLIASMLIIGLADFPVKNELVAQDCDLVAKAKAAQAFDTSVPQMPEDAEPAAETAPPESAE